MAARRCSICAINYGLGVGRCPKCGCETWHSESSTPDEEPKALAAGELPPIGAQRGDAEGWRRMQYERMGFTIGQAATLARTRGADGFFLDWHRVELLLGAAQRKRDARAARDVVFDLLA